MVAAQKGWNGKDDSLTERGHYGPSSSLKTALTVAYTLKLMPIVLQVKTLSLKSASKCVEQSSLFIFYKTDLYCIAFFNQSYSRLFHSSPIYKNNHPLSFIHVVLQNTALFWCREIGR